MKVFDIKLMLATNAPVRNRAGWIYELKYDGYRMLAGKENGQVQLLSRNGYDATAWYPSVTEALQGLPGSWIIDAEVCILDERGIPDFEALRGSRGRRQGVALFVFDLLASRGRDLRKLPLLERKTRLRKLAYQQHPSIGYVDGIEEKADELYAYAIKIGVEGIVGKKADSPYVGGRSPLWLKSKPAGHHDGWKRAPRKQGKS